MLVHEFTRDEVNLGHVCRVPWCQPGLCFGERQICREQPQDRMRPCPLVPGSQQRPCVHPSPFITCQQIPCLIPCLIPYLYEADSRLLCFPP